MIFYYIRHGDPIYDPDSLTPLGTRQAEALSKRLALYGLDKIYCSTSNRAFLTAKPTCELLNKEAVQLDFANEGYAWRDLTVEKEDGSGKRWLFHDQKSKDRFNTKEIRDLGDRWYDAPGFEQYEAGINRVYNEADARESGETLDGAPVYYLEDCLRDIKGPAMAEGLDYLDGRVITLTESASDKYIFGKLFFANKIVSLEI
jgi:broad specificity phosphatase PhoE